MRDWKSIVQERLAGLTLGPEEKTEVIAELAGHLEETFEELRQQGLPEEAAISRALSLVKDWHELQRKIETARNKEKLMTDRVKQWWLPGFVALFLSVMLLRTNEFIGIKPLIVSAYGSQLGSPVAVIYLPWLLSLIPIGAMAAYLAGRAGGSQRAMFLSTVFPVLPHLALFLFAFPVSLIIEDHVAHNIMRSAFLVLIVVWVIIPGAALLAGGLPVQLLRSRRSASA
jgi:hypothetical protein